MRECPNRSWTTFGWIPHPSIKVAVEIRYPGPMINISHDEARGAMATAETAWQFVLSRLPEELHPYLIGPDNHVRPG